MPNKRILVTNDDGIYSTGIDHLAQALREIGEVIVVAPEGERSGSGHSFTKRLPLRKKRVKRNGNFFGYSTSGTPADSVKLGLFESKGKVDWVVSGINSGGNLGIDVFYSGTVGGALEGAIDGYPSAAFSLVPCGKTSPENLKYSVASRIVRDLLKEFMQKGVPPGICLNVNIPNLKREEIKGVAITPQARQRYQDTFELREDPFGQKYYWLTGKIDRGNQAPDSDLIMIRKKFITITPLSTDLTHNKMLEGLKEWNLQI